MSLLAIAVKFTGDFANDVAIARDGRQHPHAASHEQAADRATTAVFILSLISGAALWRSRGGKEPGKGWILLIVLVGVASAGMYAYTAHTGGQIHHPYLREGGK
jgi:hypothetical protein